MHGKRVSWARGVSDGSGLGYRPGEPARSPARPVRDLVDAMNASLTARRITTTIGLTIGFVLMVAMGAQRASAGTYVMRNCSVPGHGNALLYPWRPFDHTYPNLSTVDGCATGHGLAVTLGDSHQIGGGSRQGIRIAKPSGPRSEIKFVKLALWYAARLSGTGQSLYFWSGDVRSGGSFHAGLSNSPPGSEYVVAEQMLSPDTQDVQMAVQCGSFGVVSPEPCVATHRVPLLIRGIEVTLSEDVPPIVLPPAGTLLEGGPQAGIRTVTFAASDAQSGLSKVDVLLNDLVVASHDLTPRCPHSDFTVCPATEDGTFQIDTSGVPNGSYRLMVRVRDAAGNEQVAQSESAVEVFNQPKPAAAAHVPAYELSARFKGASRPTLSVQYGRRVSVTGRLTQGSQPAAAGIPIEVLERPDRRGAREVREALVKTQADGSFSAVLATTRPSRRVRLAYRPTGGGQVVSQTLRLRVRAASRVRASLRGRVVRFSGRVLSRPIPRAGMRVLMEGRAPGSAWTAFKSLRTDRRGRFSGSYRLRVRRPGVTLKIRVLVRAQGGYGYLTSRSGAVTLRVR